LRDNLVATSVQFGGESWRVLGSVVRTKPMVKTEPTKGPDAGDSRHPADLPGYERFLEMVNASDRFGHLSNREYRRLRLRHDDRAE
jgi:hypothetical protein